MIEDILGIIFLVLFFTAIGSMIWEEYNWHKWYRDQGFYSEVKRTTFGRIREKILDLMISRYHTDYEREDYPWWVLFDECWWRSLDQEGCQERSRNVWRSYVRGVYRLWLMVRRRDG